jgi:uncharacterized protein (TIGR00299 family) protein
VLHLDAFSGVAGNMFLGALLDAGLPQKELEGDLAGLGLAHRLRVTRVRRGALAAIHVGVEVPAGAATGRSRRKAAAARSRWISADQPLEPTEPGVGAGHAHPHGRARVAGGLHAHGAHVHAHAAGEGRSFGEIRELLEKARLARSVRERALAIFEALARAEARVHRMPIERVHFHEVGAVDALVDVAGAAIGLARLSIDRVTCSPLALGHGMVEMRHGRLPIPAPATLELLKGVPTVPAHAAFETVTPTGAAIVRTIVDEFGTMPALVPEAIGHGAGRDRPGPTPNVLRAVLGRAGGPQGDRVVCLETNLDDLPPEHFEYVMERLFDAGALDVSLLHQQMKKNRPGFLLRVLARPADRLTLARVLFAESTAIGVRGVEYDRLVLPRETLRVRTRYGTIAVKVVRDPTGRDEPSAEYDDCKRAARRHGAPLRDVVQAAEAAARERLR